MWPSLKTRPDCGCSTSAFPGDVLREGGARDARRVFARQKKPSPKIREGRKNHARAARRRHGGGEPGTAEVFFSRKMVNVLNVDRHRQSVAWIKLCIIENGCSVPARARAAGGGRVGRSREARRMRALRASRAFGRIRLCIRRWATPDNRRFRPSLSARKVQPSESRSAGIKRPRICTHSCLVWKNRKIASAGTADERRAPFSAKPSDGMLNWRHGRTRGLPDNYSGPSRDVSSQA